MNIEFYRLTWRLGGIKFYLTTETRLNFQQPNFPGVYFDKWAFVWYGYNVEISGTRGPFLESPENFSGPKSHSLGFDLLIL